VQLLTLPTVPVTLRMLCAAAYMRERRAQWATAARVLQAAARRMLDRRALAASLAAIRRGVAAVTALQAAWRGRPARAGFLRMKSAAVTIQVRPLLTTVDGCSFLSFTSPETALIGDHNRLRMDALVAAVHV